MHSSNTSTESKHLCEIVNIKRAPGVHLCRGLMLSLFIKSCSQLIYVSNILYSTEVSFPASKLITLRDKYCRLCLLHNSHRSN